jgi:hypothetical protein
LYRGFIWTVNTNKGIENIPLKSKVIKNLYIVVGR